MQASLVPLGAFLQYAFPQIANKASTFPPRALQRSTCRDLATDMWTLLIPDTISFRASVQCLGSR